MSYIKYTYVRNAYECAYITKDSNKTVFVFLPHKPYKNMPSLQDAKNYLHEQGFNRV